MEKIGKQVNLKRELETENLGYVRRVVNLRNKDEDYLKRIMYAQTGVRARQEVKYKRIMDEKYGNYWSHNQNVLRLSQPIPKGILLEKCPRSDPDYRYSKKKGKRTKSIMINE